MMRLAMIVRDEAQIIERCLASVRGYIDSWLIVDTGSVDRTRQVVEEFLEGIPGRLLNRPWVNFGYNRTELVELASEGTEFLLCLDADMEIETTGRATPQYDANFVSINSAYGDYMMPLILKASEPWYYVGRTHEYLDCKVPFTRGPMTDIRVHDRADGATRPDKLQRDLKLLMEEVQEGTETPRTMFYLAQTLEELGAYPEAIQWYRLRTEIDSGFEEERFVAQYRLGCLLCTHVAFSAGAPELLKAWEMRPSRNEPLHALANSAKNVAKGIPLPDDILFVDKGGYEG